MNANNTLSQNHLIVTFGEQQLATTAAVLLITFWMKESNYYSLIHLALHLTTLPVNLK